MLVLDAFFLSHTSEPVDVPDQDVVDGFLPRRVARYKLDVNEPHAFGALTRPDVYMEMRLRQQEAMEEARQAMEGIDLRWGAKGPRVTLVGKGAGHQRQPHHRRHRGVPLRRRRAAAGHLGDHHLHRPARGGRAAGPGRSRGCRPR